MNPKSHKQPLNAIRKKFSGYGRAHRRACYQSVQHLWRSPIGNFLSLLAMSITLALPLLLYVSTSGLLHFAQTIDPGNSLTVYFEIEATEGQIEAALTRFSHLNAIATIQHLTPEEVKADYLHWQPHQTMLNDLPTNPFPHLCVLTPQPGISIDTLRQIQSETATLPGIDSVSMDDAWVQRLHAWIALGKACFTALATLLSLGAILIICNTIRLTLTDHRQEIALLFQLGATKAMIQRPFLYRGLLIGCLAGIVSFLMVSLLTSIINPVMSEVIQFYNDSIYPVHFPWREGLIVLLGGGTLGFLGALLAVQVEFKRLH